MIVKRKTKSGTLQKLKKLEKNNLRMILAHGQAE